MLFFQAYLAVTLMTALPVAADISHRSRLSRELRISGEKFRLFAQHSTDILFHFNLNGTILYVSPSIMRLAGYDHRQLLGQNAMNLVAPEQRDETGTAFRETIARAGETKSHDFLFVMADGSMRWFESHARLVVDKNGASDGIVSFVRDISDRKTTEGRWLKAAMTDPLTGIANRRAFRAHVEQRMAGRSSVSGDCLAVLDLDHFKVINDSFGHAVGDLVLRDFATLARRIVREHDFVARIGGEEFAIFFPDTPVKQALLICDRVRLEMAHTDLRVGSVAVRVTVSGGVSQIGPRGLDDALKNADIALYEAKRSGRDRFAQAA